VGAGSGGPTTGCRGPDYWVPHISWRIAPGDVGVHKIQSLTGQTLKDAGPRSRPRSPPGPWSLAPYFLNRFFARKNTFAGRSASRRMK
jgi:hypothetical protein